MLTDPRFAAEPKVDGQRAQLHIDAGRTVACYSRPGRELLALPGLGWLRTLRWPVQSAILDGKLFSGGGSDGIDAVLAARQRGGSDTAVAVFDLLQLDGQDVMTEPWVDRRKRLEDVFPAGIDEPRMQLVPACDDASRLWATWVVEWGAEGIVLKDRRSVYRPGVRSRCWWKVKNKLVLPVEVLKCADTLVPWGDWGQACVMAFEYRDARSGEVVTVEPAVRVGDQDRGEALMVGRGSEALRGWLTWHTNSVSNPHSTPTRELEQQFGILLAPNQAEPDFTSLVQECRERALSISLLFIDIDDFKRVNTEFTEPVVDRAILRETMTWLKAQCSYRGEIYRTGRGDEFLIILPNVESEEARGFAERIRSGLAERPFVVGQGKVARITVSIGVSTWPGDGEHYQAVLEAASAAKAEAKKTKNAVARHRNQGARNVGKHAVASHGSEGARNVGQPAFEPIANVSETPGRSTNAHVIVDEAGTLHLAWSERAGGGSVSPYSVLLYRRSLDRGHTFTAPVKIVVGDMYSGTYGARLAATTGSVYLLWDRRGAKYASAISFCRSRDGGASFDGPLGVSFTPDNAFGGRIAVAPDGTIVAAWTESKNRLLIARSFDGGVTFERPRALFNGPVRNAQMAVSPTTGALYLAWEAAANDGVPHIWLARSLNSGDSFSSLVDPGSSLESRNPTLAVGASERIHVAWQQVKQPLQSQGTVETTPYNIMYSQSSDNGQTFSIPAVLSDQPFSYGHSSDYPSVAEGLNGTIAVAWEDCQKQTHAGPGSPPATSPQIVMKLSADGGRLFGPLQHVSQHSDAASRGVRAVYGPDDTLYVVWQDEGSGEVLMRRVLAALRGADAA